MKRRRPGRILFFRLQQELTDLRLKEVETFIEHSRKGMRAAWEEFSRKFDSATAGYSKERIAEYVDLIYDDMVMLRDASPLLLRQAHCLMVYGTFENSLAKLCRAAYRDKKLPGPPPRELYMVNAKEYLLLHVGKRPVPFAKDWEWLDELRIIRNWIAHNGARVQRDTLANGKWTKANRFIRRNRGLIKFTEHDDIVIEDALVDRALQKAKNALACIGSAMKVLYR